jgi:UDP-glucuronate 4-epimerase
LNALITGAAGFIGSHLVERLLAEGRQVIGVDNFDDFYDPEIKRRNIASCLKNRNFRLIEADIRDSTVMEKVVAGTDIIVHLAAKAGVRPSIAQPLLYADVNINGTMVLLEAAAKHNIRRFVFASSSSVYGNNKKVPFAEDDNVDYPISPYAATKKSGELLCHTYHYLHDISVTCLRFFSVYGPRQRPDLAIHKFAGLIEEGKPIPVFGDGSMMRDFTYIDDIIDGTVAAIGRLVSSPSSNGPRITCQGSRVTSHGFNIYTLGNSKPISVNDLITEIEKVLGRKAIKQYLPPPPGDVECTCADITKASSELDYHPKTDLPTGLAMFASWLIHN